MPYWIEVASTERLVKRTIAKMYYRVKMGVEDSITLMKRHHVMLELIYLRAVQWEDINPLKIH